MAKKALETEGPDPFPFKIRCYQNLLKRYAIPLTMHCLSLKKAIWNNVDEPEGHYVKGNKTVTEGQILHHSNSHEVSKIIKLTEAKNRTACCQELGGGEAGSF